MPAPSRDLIRGIPLFAETDEKFLDELAKEFNERTYKPGDLIAEEGERGRTFFVIESGEATVHGQGRHRGSRVSVARLQLQTDRREPSGDDLGTARGVGAARSRR